MSIRLWQPIVINRRGGNGGGGGGDVVVKEEKYPFIMNGTYVASFSATSYFLPFNLNNNKMVASLAGYTGGLSIISLTTNGYTEKPKVNSDVPSLSNIAIYKDDSFVVYHYSGKLNYVPVTSNYTFGTPISVDITGFGYGTNIHKVIILSPTRFAFFEYNNTKIGIFKLENGSLVEDKYIDATNLNLTGVRIFSFKENLGLIMGYTGTTGIRIIDPDTEATIYEDLRADGTNKPYEAQEKDNLLFLECANNTAPYITEPIMVYEYSNGTISKKNMTIKNFEVKQYNGGNLWVYKQSESVYILTTSITSRTEMQIMICDIEKGTIETSFCAGTIGNPPTTSYIVTLNDGTSRVFQTNNVGSYPSYTRFYYGFLYTEKTATVLEYNTNTYGLTTLGE